MDASRTRKPILKGKSIDRGWAWVVLVSSYIGLIIFSMTGYMYGVIYIALLRQFGESVTKTSLVPTLQSILFSMGGELINPFPPIYAF